MNGDTWHLLSEEDCRANASVHRRTAAWQRKCAATARTKGHKAYHEGEEESAARRAHMWDERASRMRHHAEAA